MELRAITEVFSAAANWCANTVSRIPDTAWGNPGLGEWNLRSLVGHTSRALSTAVHAIETPAQTVELTTAEDYFRGTSKLPQADPHTVRDRGITAGADLGDDPAEAFRDLAHAAIAALESAVNSAEDPIVTSVAGSMRLSEYLRTRVFELVVHGLDIQAAEPAAAKEVPLVALQEASRIAQNLAVLRGDGPQLLFALTGRGSLSAGYSVLA